MEISFSNGMAWGWRFPAVNMPIHKHEELQIKSQFLDIWRFRYLQSHVADSSALAPFKPPSSGSTSHAVEASGTTKPGEVAPIVDRNVTTTNNTLTRPVPPRPWQNNGTSYGGYGSNMYNSRDGSGMYGLYGGLGGSYSGLYGNNMYSGYGGSMEVQECMVAACIIVALVDLWVVMDGGGMYNAWVLTLTKIQIIHMVLHHRHQAFGCPFFV